MLWAEPPVTPRRLRIALVSLYALENSGVRIVASALRQAGFEVTEVYFKDWVNNRFPWPTEAEAQQLLGLLRRRSVDVVGLSVRASAFHRLARYLTDRLREGLGVKVGWGGMHPTFLPERCIPLADWVAVGEVDHAVVDFFTAWDEGRQVTAVPGFWVREGDTIHRNDVAPLVELDEVPRRDFHTQGDKFAIEGDRCTPGDPFIRNPEYTTLASRGCPYWTCTFCSNTVTRPLYEGLGRTVRVRSVENLIQELEYARRCCPDMRVVRFDDEVFPFRRAWLEAFREQWPARVGLPFEILVDPRMVAEEPLRLLQEAGLRAVCMGVQGSERVNRELYHRDTTRAQIVEAQRVFARLGLRANLQVIWDDPLSTDEDHEELFRMFLELPRPFEIFLFGLTVYPGTHLARRLLREGRITEDDVEGANTHAFEQFRVDLGYPRPDAERRWLALLVLCNKPFLPPALVRRLYQSERLRADPRPLVALAQAANLVHMGRFVAELAAQGELTPLLIRRWLNPKSLVTM